MWANRGSRHQFSPGACKPVGVARSSPARAGAAAPPQPHRVSGCGTPEVSAVQPRALTQCSRRPTPAVARRGSLPSRAGHLGPHKGALPPQLRAAKTRNLSAAAAVGALAVRAARSRGPPERQRHRAARTSSSPQHARGFRCHPWPTRRASDPRFQRREETAARGSGGCGWGSCCQARAPPMWECVWRRGSGQTTRIVWVSSNFPCCSACHFLHRAHSLCLSVAA